MHFTGPNVILIWYTGTGFLGCIALAFCIIVLFTYCIMNLVGKDKTQGEDSTVNSVTCFVI